MFDNRIRPHHLPPIVADQTGTDPPPPWAGSRYEKKTFLEIQSQKIISIDTNDSKLNDETISDAFSKSDLSNFHRRKATEFEIIMFPSSIQRFSFRKCHYKLDGN